MSEQETPVYKSTPAVCAICGDKGEVAFGLVRWRDPLPGAVFDSAWRCKDRDACRARTEALGDIWPVDDGTPATRSEAFAE